MRERSGYLCGAGAGLALLTATLGDETGFDFAAVAEEVAVVEELTAIGVDLPLRVLLETWAAAPRFTCLITLAMAVRPLSLSRPSASKRNPVHIIICGLTCRTSG